MALAQDLMGLGESSLAAARMAPGGTGPATLAAAGTNAATAAAISFLFIENVSSSIDSRAAKLHRPF